VAAQHSAFAGACASSVRLRTQPGRRLAGNKSRHPSVFFPCSHSGRGSSRNRWQTTRRTASTAAVVGLVKVANLKAGGMGSLGAEQLAWLADDLKGKSASTPIVLFAHISRFGPWRR
jgi:hypothetical protein